MAKIKESEKIPQNSQNQTQNLDNKLSEKLIMQKISRKFWKQIEKKRKLEREKFLKDFERKFLEACKTSYFPYSSQNSKLGRK